MAGSQTTLTAGGDEAIFVLLTQMEAEGGWTRTHDSDGQSGGYRTSAPFTVTGYGSGANGLGNASAFIALESPDATLWISFQRGSTHDQWRVKAAAEPFAVAGDDTHVPGTTVSGDQHTLCGGGSDASPTFQGLYTAASLTGRWQVYVDAPTGSAMGQCFDTGGSVTRTFVLFDKTTGVSPDDRPWISRAAWHATNNVCGYPDGCSVSNATPGSYLLAKRINHFGATKAWNTLDLVWLCNGDVTILSNAAAVPTVDPGGGEWFMPVLYQRRTTFNNPGIQGQSTCLRLTTNMASRTTGDVTWSGSDYLLRLSTPLAALWDSTTVLQ